MNLFVFTRQAKRAFEKLPKTNQVRISDKLKELKSHPNLMSALRPLVGMDPATHRLRVGEYRLILELRKWEDKGVELWILDVGHRKEIYR